MKKSRLIETQIISILKQRELGTAVPEICREHGISNATYSKWKSKYGGMDISTMTPMKELEAENSFLKRMYAQERFKAEIVQEGLQKNINDTRWQGKPLKYEG